MMIEPFGFVLVFEPPPALVDLDQQAASMMPSARACYAKRRETIPARPGRCGRRREFVEIFEDDPQIVERLAILKDERRDFAERILLAQAVFGIDVSASTTSILSVRSSSEAAILILRPNGEAGEERSVSMGHSCEMRMPFMKRAAPPSATELARTYAGGPKASQRKPA